MPPGRAQQRPGPKPRQHMAIARPTPGSAVAQQRPGPKPRQHPLDCWGDRSCRLRSTKAGTEAPATPSRPPGPGLWWASLNKGRDRSPGNTGTAVPAGGNSPDAQQRPGPKPRQHRIAVDHHRRLTRRSTKAGTEAPATREGETAPLALVVHAQQRPGPKPRQHGGKGTRMYRGALSLNKGRDRSPGNTCGRPGRAASSPALNKGRDRSPGNTCRQGQRGRPRWRRSTKAGTEAPATRGRGLVPTCGRGRSTKAGTEAPATPLPGWPLAWAWSPLNKGRDRSPGNTSPQPRNLLVGWHAQQRPGPKPRQHR